MRRPSRLMPHIRKRPVSVLGRIVLGCLLAGTGIGLWRHPLLVGGCLLLCICYVSAHSIITRRHLRRLAAERTTEDIGSFTKQFERRSVDTWVIRAFYEELQDYLRPKVNSFPVRASDRLSEDLKIDKEDLEDEIACNVVERTGRSYKEMTSNPYYGRVKTVGDLVFFFNEQPSLNRS